MRNGGGFHNPPQIPESPTDIRRAVELLGSFTQRKHMRDATRRELANLLGELPPSRLVAQQWKFRLRAQSRPRASPPVTAFRHHDELVAQLPLPHAQTDLSRAFILLEVLRRRLSAGMAVSARLSDQLERILGTCPATSMEARRYVHALVFLQRRRRRAERLPPVIPLHDLDGMRVAIMLLGAYSVRGSVGAQSRTLVSLIGTLPRNRNVALSWKKMLAAAVRKRKRKQRVLLKRSVDDAKRLQRRLKRRRLEADQLALAGLQEECAPLQPVSDQLEAVKI